jgi:enamine deaminase RidA (YjgF/YER057c/UK114 family)
VTPVVDAAPTATDATTPEQRLARLGLALPEVPQPAANYVPWKRVDSLVYVAGQIPFVRGQLAGVGKVGIDVSLDRACELAGIAALNALAVGAAAAGSLGSLTVVHLTVFVSSAPDFTFQHLVADGASEILVAVLGEAGRHPRTAVATPVLPLDAPVEVQATFWVP